MDHVLPYIAGIGCSFCYGAATILEQIAVRRQKSIGSLHPSHIVMMVRQGAYLYGILLDITGWILFLLVARMLPLFLALSFVAASIAVSAVLAHKYLGVTASRKERLAIIGMMAGLIILGAVARPASGHAMNHVFRIALEGAPIALGLVGLAVLRAPQRWSSAFGLAALSGLAFGGTGLIARFIRIGHITPHFILLSVVLVLYGVLGALFMAAALQRDSVNRVNGALYASELVIPSILGIVFLGDRARNGLWPVLVFGLACIVVSVTAIVVDAKAMTKNPVRYE